MKIKQLFRNVSLLGFGIKGERIPKEDFLAALNLAVTTLASVAPLLERVEYNRGEAIGSEGGLTEFDASSFAFEMASDSVVAERQGVMARSFVSEGKLYVPAHLFKLGETISISYARKPKMADLDGLDKNIDVDIAPEAEYLLPYLTASIVWADSEPELAEQYRGFFEDHLPTLRGRAAERAASMGFSASYSSPWLLGVR